MDSFGKRLPTKELSSNLLTHSSFLNSVDKMISRCQSKCSLLNYIASLIFNSELIK